jgi:hypothetical protein
VKKISPWLDDTPVIDVTTATQDELLDAWAANRNSTLAVMASEEVTRRLFKQREETKK